MEHFSSGLDKSKGSNLIIWIHVNPTNVKPNWYLGNFWRPNSSTRHMVSRICVLCLLCLFLSVSSLPGFLERKKNTGYNFLFFFNYVFNYYCYSYWDIMPITTSLIWIWLSDKFILTWKDLGKSVLFHFIFNLKIKAYNQMHSFQKRNPCHIFCFCETNQVPAEHQK